MWEDVFLVLRSNKCDRPKNGDCIKGMAHTTPFGEALIDSLMSKI